MATCTLTITNGSVTTQLDVDPASGRVLRTRYTSMRAGGPTPGPAQTVNELSDWRTVDGINFAFAYRRSENGEEVSSTTVNEIKVNPPVDPKQFEKPAGEPTGEPH